jgi:hypothetical protein
MFKAIDKWLPGYLDSVLRRPRACTRPRHLLFCVADHFEPRRGGVDAAAARADVASWVDAYPGAVRGFRDAAGRPAQHTFFYPHEEYDPAILDRLAGLCREGFGEVEIHLHHRHDTAEGLRRKLESFRDTLGTAHGLLGRDAAGAARYGFIHGNWALGNSRPDGDWCGVNEELGILAATGCYADFTFPSAPSPTQARMVNAIYRATDTPGRPRGADRGVRVGRETADHRPQTADHRPQTADHRPQTVEREEGKGTTSNIQRPTPNVQVEEQGNRLHPNTEHRPVRRSSQSEGGTPNTGASALMLIPGPLALNWRWRKWGILPRLENAELSGVNPPTGQRLKLWAGLGIGVGGQPDWVFVKVHTHGCVPANRAVIMGPAMRDLHEALQRGFNDGAMWRLHYVTAREMYNLARAAEDGKSGNPAPWRDYEVGPPPLHR